MTSKIRKGSPLVSIKRSPMIFHFCYHDVIQRSLKIFHFWFIKIYQFWQIGALHTQTWLLTLSTAQWAHCILVQLITQRWRRGKVPPVDILSRAAMYNVVQCWVAMDEGPPLPGAGFLILNFGSFLRQGLFWPANLRAHYISCWLSNQWWAELHIVVCSWSRSREQPDFLIFCRFQFNAALRKENIWVKQLEAGFKSQGARTEPRLSSDTRSQL